jgi:hypothetical protein
MRSWLGCCAAVLVLAAAGQASATMLYFKAHLAGAGEVPAIASAGQGDLTAQVDTDTRVFRYKATYSGLTGEATGAHFHGPGRPGEDAPTVVMVSDPSSPISGEALLTGLQISDVRKGLWYFNVHTAANPGGEIRGQLNQDHSVRAPERPPPQAQQPDFPVDELQRPASLSAR